MRLDQKLGKTIKWKIGVPRLFILCCFFAASFIVFSLSSFGGTDAASNSQDKPETKPVKIVELENSIDDLQKMVDAIQKNPKNRQQRKAFNVLIKKLYQDGKYLDALWVTGYVETEQITLFNLTCCDILQSDFRTNIATQLSDLHNKKDYATGLKFVDKIEGVQKIAPCCSDICFGHGIGGESLNFWRKQFKELDPAYLAEQKQATKPENSMRSWVTPTGRTDVACRLYGAKLVYEAELKYQDRMKKKVGVWDMRAVYDAQQNIDELDVLLEDYKGIVGSQSKFYLLCPSDLVDLVKMKQKMADSP